jgi:hypothetical protein
MLKGLGSIPTEDEAYTETNTDQQLIILQRTVTNNIIQDEVDRQHSILSTPKKIGIARRLLDHITILVKMKKLLPPNYPLLDSVCDSFTEDVQVRRKWTFIKVRKLQSVT